MTVDNCKRLLAHYEAKGMVAEAKDMKANLLRKGVSLEAPKPKK